MHPIFGDKTSPVQARFLLVRSTGSIAVPPLEVKLSRRLPVFISILVLAILPGITDQA